MAKHNLLASKANSVKTAVTATGDYGFDPMIILAILSALLPMLQQCWKTPQATLTALREPNRLTKFVVRRQCRKEGCCARDADLLTEAILAECETLTESEIIKLTRGE